MAKHLLFGMANRRKDAIAKIESQQLPLLKLIFQIYLFGNTRTLLHWKKEFNTVLWEIQKNVSVKKGKTLNSSDVFFALDQIAFQRNLATAQKTLLADPDYKTFFPRKKDTATTDKMKNLLLHLSVKVLSVEGTEIGSATDALIEEIFSW